MIEDTYESRALKRCVCTVGPIVRRFGCVVMTHIVVWAGMKEMIIIIKGFQSD